MRNRLSVKLILSLTVIVVLIKAVFGFMGLRTQQRHLVDTMVLGADQLSRSITSATWQAMLDDHRTVAYDIMSKIAEKQGVDRIRIYNGEGLLTYSTRAEEAGLQLTKLDSPCTSCHGPGQTRLDLTVQGRSRMSVSQDGVRTLNMVTPIYNEPACSNAACHAHPVEIRVLGVLDVALSTQPLEDEEASVKAQVLISTLVQMGLIALFIVFFTRYFVTLPIRELIDGTKQVSAMELDKPIVIEHGSVEMDELVSSFNTMRERLRGAVTELNLFTQSLEEKVSQRTEQLRAAHQKLLHSDRLASLGQLSASVAHEINNPISGVLNLSMLLQRMLKQDGVPPERLGDFRRYLQQISSETTRVGRIVSDLLAFSRRSKPQRTQANLNKIIRNTVSLVGHKLKLCDATAILNLDEQLPLLQCDASQMQQVVLNLVMNGAEATQGKGDGKVIITTRLSDNKQNVEMIVEDNGEGIPREIINKIFEPFFTSKADGKGVGLGLAVLYGIVREHDGEVEVSSQVGVGTRFTISLPLVAAGIEEEPAVRG
ncbi:MAG: HAMP domain-containing protein [Bryobacteraceae bacterium]|nr:HAMP domain-containing protein [Bryobacteraceae bacterium]